jgi:hypothetical protein
MVKQIEELGAELDHHGIADQSVIGLSRGRARGRRSDPFQGRANAVRYDVGREPVGAPLLRWTR